MNSRSAKAKGRRLQQEVRDSLLEAFKTNLEPDDIKCAIMGERGEDLKLSPAARKLIPYSFECKNQEKISIWSALEQAKENCKESLSPVLVFRKNHTPTYVAITYEHFISLIKKVEQPTTINSSSTIE